MTNRLRSIVPMFGEGTSFVETLEAIVRFVDEAEPTTDRLVQWHRDRFARVSSATSVMRRVRYLENVGFLAEAGDRWDLGPHGSAVLAGDRAQLAEIMCSRNVGLRSLLYALEAGPMTIGRWASSSLRRTPSSGGTPMTSPWRINAPTGCGASASSSVSTRGTI